MAAYIALYRKWRPKNFQDLVGQEHISRTLSNAIASGRIGHAYLFSGPRGTGKTSTAKIFAKSLNCEKGPTTAPCNACESCRKINDGSSMDVLEIDAASNRGIDEIRELREKVKFAPVDGRYKVYIIDEVHMLTTEAFNALLKTLEEPPAHVVFILATTEAHKVPATIQSRCQRYDFKRIAATEIQKRLSLVAGEMGIPADQAALSLIAAQADGGMRDALSILDQCSSLSEGGITVESVQQLLGLIGHEWIWQMTRDLAGNDTRKVLETIARTLQEGKDLKQVLAELSLHLRSLMIYQAAGTVENMDLYSESEQVLRDQSGLFTRRQLMRMIRRLQEAMGEIKWSPQPRIAVEVALLSLCREDGADAQGFGDFPMPQPSGGAADESGRIAALEAKLAQLAARLPQMAKGTSPSAPSTVPAPAGPSQNVRASQPSQGQAPEKPLRSVSVEGKALWEGLLDALRNQDSPSVLACVEKGEFAGMNGTQFLLSFKSSFLKGRTEQEDYRKLLEGILCRLAGRDIELVCVQAGKEMPSRPSPPKPKPKESPLAALPPEPEAIDIDLDGLSQEEQERLQAAVDAFGSHFVDLEEAADEEEKL